MGNLTPLRARRVAEAVRSAGSTRRSEGSGADIGGDAARVQDDGQRAGWRSWPLKKGPAPGEGSGPEVGVVSDQK